jgi:hypothetical protein
MTMSGNEPSLSVHECLQSLASDARQISKILDYCALARCAIFEAPRNPLPPAPIIVPLCGAGTLTQAYVFAPH